MGRQAYVLAEPTGPPMQAHRTEATVGGDGSVTIGGLPFTEGERVEVIVLSAAAPRAEHPAERPARRAGSARGLITVPEDFDDPLDDFAPYS